MYSKGEGVAQDYNEAVRWYRKAANQGDAIAQYNYGAMYDNGEGVAQDYTEAAQWYRKAADQDHANAQCNLGLMYSKGEGVAQDYNEAVRLYRRAAHQGMADAQYNLGIMYRDSGNEGVAQDYNESVRWHRKAADQGNAKAQLDLGNIYFNGDGVARDLKQARSLFLAAEAQGNEKAHELRKNLDSILLKTPGANSSFGAPSSSQCACCGRVAENRVKLKPCPRCKGPFYCGKDCQREHWNGGHKECCTRS